MSTRPSPALHVARAGDDSVRYTTVGFGGPWVYVQVFDSAYEEPLTGASYTLRGATTGHSVQGTTDDQGVAYHDRLPDDSYELECRGARERVPLYHDGDRAHVQWPWPLRLRKLRSQGTDR